MWNWIVRQETILWWLGVFSIIMFFTSIPAATWVLVRLPRDYFVRDRAAVQARPQHPALRMAWHVAKNLVGGVLLVAGIAMLVLPGQGLLTILISLVLIDLPGKRAAELWLFRRRRVLRTINWIRAKYHRPPLEVEPSPKAPGAS